MTGTTTLAGKLVWFVGLNLLAAGLVAGAVSLHGSVKSDVQVVLRHQRPVPVLAQS
jgi:hypothetical protein